MHNIVLISTKVVVHVPMYFVVGYDEMTMIDSQSWVNMHTLWKASSAYPYC